MSGKVFKKIQVVGCSDQSLEDAIQIAVSKASESVHGVSWFEVSEFHGAVKDGKVVEWQAIVDVAFKVD
jgi:flavin-binding protein dodecin